MDKFQFEQKIAQTAHSVVHKGRRRHSLEFVAIKSTAKSRRQQLMEEVRLLHAIDDENIVRFHSWYETSNHLWLVGEYCAGGSLREMLSQDGALPESTVLSIGLDVLAGLRRVHREGYAMVQIEPDAVLMTEYGIGKLLRFRLARPFGTRLREEEVHRGISPHYAAPELFELAPCGAPSDAWSLGSLLHELATGRPCSLPARATSEIATSARLADLLHSLLSLHPHRRPRVDRLDEHPFWALHREGAVAASDKEEPFTDTPDATGADASPSPSDVAATEVEQETWRKTGLAAREVAAAEEDTAAAAEEAAALAVEEAALAAEEVGRLRAELGASSSVAAEEALRAEVADLSQLVFAPEEMVVRPIFLNPTIERIEARDFEERALPFRTHSAAELVAMDVPQLEAFLGELQASICGPTPPAEKANSLLYLQWLSTDALMASLLVNSGLSSAITKLASHSSNAALKAQLVTALAYLLRHATHLNQAFARGELCTLLTAAASGKKGGKLRTRAVAALGELLFYFSIRHRQQHDREAQSHSRGESPANVAERVRSHEQPWLAPASAVSALVGALSSPDRLAQHYACKAIENILTEAAHAPADSLPAALGGAAVLTQLLQLSDDETSPPPLAECAAAAAAQLLRVHPSRADACLRAIRPPPSPHAPPCASRLACLAAALCAAHAAPPRAPLPSARVEAMALAAAASLAPPLPPRQRALAAVCAAALLALGEPSLVAAVLAGDDEAHLLAALAAPAAAAAPLAAARRALDLHLPRAILRLLPSAAAAAAPPPAAAAADALSLLRRAASLHTPRLLAPLLLALHTLPASPPLLDLAAALLPSAPHAARAALAALLPLCSHAHAAVALRALRLLSQLLSPPPADAAPLVLRALLPRLAARLAAPPHAARDAALELLAALSATRGLSARAAELRLEAPLAARLAELCARDFDGDARWRAAAPPLLRLLAERPAEALGGGLVPVLQSLLRHPALEGEQLASVLESAYLVLEFVRALAHPPDGRLAARHAPDAIRAVCPLIESIPPLLPLLLHPWVPLAEKVAFFAEAVAQLLAPVAPQACCTAMLTGAAAPTLLKLLATSDRSDVRQLALQTLRRLQHADSLEFSAALAASPELEAALTFPTSG